MSDTSIAAAELTPREYLFSLLLHGIKLGLENIRYLLDAAGNPQERYPAVHVAGTNGKGSVVAFLSGMFRAAGYRVGSFTSPHLIDLTERFQIDGLPISNEELDAAIRYFRDIAERMPRQPTFFELNTAVAFRHFDRARVDAALIEVGMGGRFDSTNVITPLVAAITSIDLEHTQYLGDTLEKIAFEKAGIIKAEAPVVIGETKAGPLGVMLTRARELGSPADVIGRDFRYALSGGKQTPVFHYESNGLRLESVPLRLLGRYQGANAAVAVRMAEWLRPTFPRLDEDTISQGLTAARWPCRLERVIEGPPVIVDATHTPAGARYLGEVFDSCTVVLALSSDKDARGMLEALAPIARRLILTEFEGKRAMPIEMLRAAASHIPHETADTLAEAIARAMPCATDDCPLLITGSVFAAGEARRILIENHGAGPLTF